MSQNIMKMIVAQELHNPVIKKFNRITMYLRFKDNIFAAYIARMGSLFSFSHGI